MSYSPGDVGGGNQDSCQGKEKKTNNSSSGKRAKRIMISVCVGWGGGVG